MHSLLIAAFVLVSAHTAKADVVREGITGHLVVKSDKFIVKNSNYGDVVLKKGTYPIAVGYSDIVSNPAAGKQVTGKYQIYLPEQTAKSKTLTELYIDVDNAEAFDRYHEAANLTKITGRVISTTGPLSVVGTDKLVDKKTGATLPNNSQQTCTLKPAGESCYRIPAKEYCQAGEYSGDPYPVGVSGPHVGDEAWGQGEVKSVYVRDCCVQVPEVKGVQFGVHIGDDVAVRVELNISGKNTEAEVSAEGSRFKWTGYTTLTSCQKPAQ